MKSPILVVEDDEYLRKQICWALKDKYEVLEEKDANHARETMDKVPRIEAVLLDLHLPPRVGTPKEGLMFLAHLRSLYPDTGIIVVTGSKNTRTWQDAIKLGVQDFFSKPFDLGELKLTLKRVLHMVQLEKKVKEIQRELEEKYEFANLVGKSKKMQELFRLIAKIAPTNSTVLIRGESGTGKELIARAIHCHSPRKENHFVPVNCAALPETLLEAELFGHEKGAFTDATYKKEGMFEVADKGTIFLDEISDMSPLMQAKILRVIQERCFNRLGSTKIIQVDVRILAATNKDLEKMIQEGTFREDLYYRLNVLSISVPSLRERKEDIPLLAQHFLTRYTSLYKKKVKSISPHVMDQLCRYSWPGNIRELENVMERAIILSSGKIILLEDLAPYLRSTFPRKEPSPPSLEEGERKLILDALQATRGNQSRAAQLLGIHRTTLSRKLKNYGIQPRKLKRCGIQP